MYEYYKNHNLYFQLPDYANIVFEEVSNGVYFIVKDRTGEYSSFVNAVQVVSELNNCERKVLIRKSNGDFYSNFDIYKLIND